ncbi:hypothetical protein GCM10028808_48820 [Spirosoma migulaei]
MTRSQIFWGFAIAIVGGIIVLYYQLYILTPPPPKFDDLLSKKDSLTLLRNKDLEYSQIQKEEIRLNQAIIETKEYVISNNFDAAKTKIAQVVWILDLKYHNKSEYINRYIELQKDLSLLFNKAYSLAQKTKSKDLEEEVLLEEYGEGIHTFPDGSRLVCKYVTTNYVEVDFYYNDNSREQELGQKILIGQEHIFSTTDYNHEFGVLYLQRESSSSANFKTHYRRITLMPKRNTNEDEQL